MVSHYSYRNVQVYDDTAGGIKTTVSNYDSDRMTEVPWTRPEVIAENLAPSFKTERQHAGRALISDTFNRVGSAGVGDPATNDRWKPGCGLEGHREGYNVLFGDGHAEWYGDPQQQIIYWEPGPANGRQCALDRMSTRFGGGPTQQASAFHVWHLMDTKNQVDVGVPGP